jgi:integrase/recombinase XerD
MQAYQDALRATGTSASGIGASRTKSGTLSAAIVAYYASPSFTDPVNGFAPATRKMRRAILENWRAEDGEKSFASLRAHHISNMLANKLPNAQKNWMKAIRGLMQFAKAKNMRADDPTQGVELAKAAKSTGHMTWKAEQIIAYRKYHPLGTMARLALELLLNIAARREDAHAIGRQHMTNDRKLSWRPSKTLRSTGKRLTIAVLPELRAALDAMPLSAELPFLLNDYGKPFASAAAFGNKFADWCEGAGLEAVQCQDGRMRNYRAHGLRKAALTALAQSGCTGSELMAVSGHSSLAQVQAYIDEVDQEQQADSAMAKWLLKA